MHGLVRMLEYFLHPCHQIGERLPPRDIVDEERADGASIVRAHDATIILLPGRVPNLQLHFIAQVVNGNQALAELNSNCHVAFGIETLLGELKEQIALADRGVAHYDIFEDVFIGWL